jgi:hypothetical protein
MVTEGSQVRDAVVFGFFKRRRAKSGGSRSPSTSPPSTTPPAEQGSGEQAGRNWYSSSRELQDGLVVNEDTDDVTMPTPLDEHEPPPKGR